MMFKNQQNNTYLSSFFKKIAGVFQKNMFLRNFKKFYYYIDGIILTFIEKPKKTTHKKKKVLILYNLAFGDGVIFRCTLIHLRKLYPQNSYELTLVCQKGINNLYEKDKIFDKIICLDFNKSTVNLRERIKNFKIIREQYYDIVIDPVGIFEWTTNILYSRAVCASEKIGVIETNNKNYCDLKKIKKIYNRIVYIEKENISLIEYYAEIFNKLSNNSKLIDVGFEKIKTSPNKLDLPEKYYIIFPSASMKLKRWSLDKYALIAQKIYNKTGLTLVLVGTKADEEIIDVFASKLSVPYINLLNKTSLNDYIDILKKASLIITNDTSAYHIAVIEEVPVAIITGGYTYHKYVEYKFPRYKEFKRPCIIVNDMNCFNCQNRCKHLTKQSENWPCLETITVGNAWKVIEKMIDDLDRKKIKGE